MKKSLRVVLSLTIFKLNFVTSVSSSMFESSAIFNYFQTYSILLHTLVVFESSAIFNYFQTHLILFTILYTFESSAIFNYFQTQYI